ncbi:unnamed protein product [Adineta steineri]|uniref:NHL repeat containing protein n=1 Tax=Adineta steineri TaxID=433720 RepID=A0A814JE47_9BILA|nr:unnamed protein product [Adineta steineri]
MKEDRVSTNKLSVKKLRRRSKSLNRQRPVSSILNTQISSVIHVSVKPLRSARSTSNYKDKKESNNSLSRLTTHQSRNRSNKSVIEENSNKQLTNNETRSISVIKVRRPSSQFRQYSSKSINISNETNNSSNKHDRLGTEKDSDHHDNISNPSTSNNHIINKNWPGTIEDLTNPIHNSHGSIKNKKKENFIEYCCRCSRRRVLMYLISLILIGIILAIILIILLKKPTRIRNIPSLEAYLRWNTSATTVFGTTGLRGNTSNQLSSPFGLGFDSFGDLYIGDRYNHRIQKCNIRNLTCKTIAGQANAVSGTNMSSLNGPTFLYIDTNNNLYIADSGNQRIQFWNYGASYGTKVAGVTGSGGSGLNQFNTPYGIARDPTTNAIYICDYNNHRVMKYFSGNLTGIVIAGGNGLGINNTQLNYPAGLIFDSSTNSLIISNYGASNIVRWVIGDYNWTIIAGSSTGLTGITSTLLNHPTSVTYDPMGNMYIADMFNHRIQLYLLGQSNGTTIAGILSQPGTNSTMLNYPVSVAFDNQLNLYVADSFNQRIQKFLRY